MNRSVKYLFFVLIEALSLFIDSFASSSISSNQCPCSPDVKTVFIPMSQGANLYTQYHKPMYDIDNKIICADVSLTYRFQQAANGKDIALALFENNPLVFIGSNGTSSPYDRPKNALIAEYFGLAPDTNVSLNILPRIRNQIIDLQLCFGSNKLWFQINIPITKAQWETTTYPISSNNFVGSDYLQDGNSIQIGSKNAGATISDKTQDTGQSSPNNYNLLNVYSIDGDLNQSPEDFSEMMSGLNINGSLSSENDQISIGSWSDVSFVPVAMVPNSDYNLALSDQNNLYVEEDLANFSISNNAQPVYTAYDQESDDDIAVAYFNIYQTAAPSAPTLSQGLSGWFPGVATRQYNLSNLYPDTTLATWGVSDLQMWFGWDFVKKDCSHCGIYLKFVVPTGTIINQDWCVFAFNPVVGNGRHYELGIGASAHCDICSNDERVCTVAFDGYITHPFNTMQFRTFDLCGDPMSRYAMVKQLSLSGASGDSEIEIPTAFNYSLVADNPTSENIKNGTVVQGAVQKVEIPGNINDEYSFNNLIKPIGDINCGNISVGIGIKGEAILDIFYTYGKWKAGVGYAFTGQTSENIDQCSISNPYQGEKNIYGQFYYGYKGLTGMANLIVLGEDFYRNASPVPSSYVNVPLIEDKWMTDQNSGVQSKPIIVPPLNGSSETYDTVTPPSTIPPTDLIDKEPNDSGGFKASYFYATPILIKTNADVAVGINRAAYQYGIGTRDDEGGSGTTPEDVFILPNLQNNNTALMNGQVLNRIFGHIDYVWDSLWQPRIGILGSYGFTCNKYITAAYWDLGFLFGFSF
jgi:hypothetical protein